MEVSKITGCVLALGAILFGAYGFNAHQYAAGMVCVLLAWVCLMGITWDWPFISPSRHVAEAELWDRILEEKNERIKQLEAERRLLWDKICLLGIGAPVFTSLAGDDPTPPEETKGKQGGNTVPTPMRPSAIMRRMDRLAEARWMRKINPSASNTHHSEIKNTKPENIKV